MELIRDTMAQQAQIQNWPELRAAAAAAETLVVVAVAVESKRGENKIDACKSDVGEVEVMEKQKVLKLQYSSKTLRARTTLNP